MKTDEVNTSIDQDMENNECLEVCLRISNEDVQLVCHCVVNHNPGWGPGHASQTVSFLPVVVSLIDIIAVQPILTRTHSRENGVKIRHSCCLFGYHVRTAIILNSKCIVH